MYICRSTDHMQPPNIDNSYFDSLLVIRSDHNIIFEIHSSEKMIFGLQIYEM